MPLRGLWLAASLLLITIGIAAGQTTILVLGLLLLLAGGAARLWSRLALTRVSYERIFPETRAFSGEKLPFTVRLTNRKLLPLPWIEVREHFPDDLPPDGLRLAPSHLARTGYLLRSAALAWYERLNWRYDLVCKRRGYYPIGPVTLRASDLFGLFPVEQQVEGVQRIIVYPKVIPLPELGLPSQRPPGERRGGARIYEDPLRIAGVRDYQPGDSLRRIDWKATARRGHLQSRVYEPSATLHLMVALNLATLEQTWAGYDPLLLERIVTVAASLATQANQQGQAVGLLTNGSFPGADRPIRILPGRHPHHLSRILEALATAGPFVISPLEEILKAESHSLPLGTTLTVVTALLPESLLAVLGRLKAAGHHVIVISVKEDGPEGSVNGVSVRNIGGYLRQWEEEQQP
ncbi:MAG: DUF58 domain-containing protein [Dehalococcoidia bacterium]